jgi:Mn-dependent DtxR family transcriptional regulator
MFSIGVMGISRLNNTQGNHLDLKDFLFGNVLGISNEDIILSLIVTIYCVISIVVFYRYFFITTFQSVMAETMGISTKAVHYFLMLMLSFAIVAALRSVGVILVVAMLITPAATAMLLSHEMKKILVISAFVGLLSAVSGLIAAIIFDTVPGPAMVMSATLFYLLATLFSPEKGLVPNYARAIQQTKKIIQEDIIKFLHKTSSPFNENEIASKLSLSPSVIKSNLNALKKEVLITNDGVLTYKGVQKAEELVRAHRLWETYQVNNMGMANDQIHDDAERLEHHLSKADLAELDYKLGYPDFDPHGSPIPKAKVISTKSIIYQKPKSKISISKNQLNNQVESELWELGILPKSSLLIYKVDENGVEVKLGDKTIFIPNELAANVIVD